MLVEDNRVNQALIVAFLKKSGHVCDVANHGVEALGMIQKKSYDLLLMDIQMPIMDGLQTTQHIRALPTPLCELPIIAVTANALNIEKEAYLAAGMNGFISKPVSQHDLVTVINETMRSMPQKISGNAV